MYAVGMSDYERNRCAVRGAAFSAPGVTELDGAVFSDLPEHIRIIDFLEQTILRIPKPRPVERVMNVRINEAVKA